MLLKNLAYKSYTVKIFQKAKNIHTLNTKLKPVNESIVKYIYVID
jgi:hypothetical protein